MAMSPGNQAITGGTVLRIPAVQSPNYVAGVSGWIVRSDGSAEFNAGTFRGSIEVGSLSGQHFWVNNPNTTDVIDVYNSSNQLVFSIDKTGRLVSASSVSTAQIVMVAANLFFEDSAQSPQIPPQIQGTLAPNQTSLTVAGGLPQNAAVGMNDSFLTFFSGITQASTWLFAGQRSFQGAVLQNDQSGGSNTNQIQHLEVYTVTTDAGGTGTFNHHCGFTPTFGFLVGINGVGANFPYQYAWFANPFTSTTAKAAFKDNLGAALASTTLGVMGMFWG